MYYNRDPVRITISGPARIRAGISKVSITPRRVRSGGAGIAVRVFMGRPGAPRFSKGLWLYPDYIPAYRFIFSSRRLQGVGRTPKPKPIIRSRQEVRRPLQTAPGTDPGIVFPEGQRGFSVPYLLSNTGQHSVAPVQTSGRDSATVYRLLHLQHLKCPDVQTGSPCDSPRITARFVSIPLLKGLFLQETAHSGRACWPNGPPGG